MPGKSRKTRMARWPDGLNYPRQSATPKELKNTMPAWQWLIYEHILRSLRPPIRGLDFAPSFFDGWAQEVKIITTRAAWNWVPHEACNQMKFGLSATSRTVVVAMKPQICSRIGVSTSFMHTHIRQVFPYCVPPWSCFRFFGLFLVTVQVPLLLIVSSYNSIFHPSALCAMHILVLC